MQERKKRPLCNGKKEKLYMRVNSSEMFSLAQCHSTGNHVTAADWDGGELSLRLSSLEILDAERCS